MNITEVRVKLMHHRSDRLRAFCSVTIDNDFVVHDLRVIEGRKGFFVAMPSRKLTDNCPRCGAKNELKAKFCSDCGNALDEARADRMAAARDKLHVDVAHPINTACREMLQATVLAAYQEEEKRDGQQAPPPEGPPPTDEHVPTGVEDLADDYVPTAVEDLADDYAPTGLEDLTEEYAELEPHEPEEVRPEEEVLVEELLAAEPEPEPLQEPVEAPEQAVEPREPEVAPEAEPEPEPPQEPVEAPEQAVEPREPEEAPETETERQRARKEREGGGFGEGIL